MSFPPVRSEPYPWPFDGGWDAGDTRLLLVDVEDEAVGPWAALADGLRRAGIGSLRTRRATRPAGDALAHRGFNAFLGTDLERRLRATGIRNLIVAGHGTDRAVHATMRAANDHGFECLLVEDATRAADERDHAAIVRITRFGNGLFGTTATVAALLAATRGGGS